jgi:hypothetical protein
MILQSSCIGYKGKFGNALFQYSVTKSIAFHFNFNYCSSSNWIGRKIFEIDDPDLIEDANPANENDLLIVKTIKNKNWDMIGFFQNPIYYQFLSTSICRNWLKIKDKWIKKFPKKKDFYIACHLRRGDMEEMHYSYPLINENSYINAVRDYGYDEKDIIWVSDNFPEIDSECEKEGIGFLPDFMTLYNSDVLFRANSTMSFWAGLLGDCRMYSPFIDFPDYGGGRIGKVDCEFMYGLGIDKEGIISK